MLNKEEIDKLMAIQEGHCAQSYEQIPDIKPESIFVKSRQATLNIGTIGHVSHGKTTVVKAITGTHVPYLKPLTEDH